MITKSIQAKRALFLVLITTLWFLYFTGGKFMNPFYVDWIFPSDTETHWLGWQFFKNESLLNFPIFKNSNYGMELGSSLVLNDSLAIMALIFKPFSSIIPFEFQYFGIWAYICFILQSFIAMKIFENFIDDSIIVILCALLFAMLPPFLWRLHGHFGLLGHWLLIYGFFIYLTSKNLNLKSWIIIVTVSLLINAYISAMLIGIFLADLIKYKVLNSNITVKALLGNFWKFIVFLLISLFTFGYFMIGKGAGGKGYGKFNANLNSFFDPDQIWSVAIGNLPTPEAGYEGFGFPGIGIYLIIGLCVVTFIFRKSYTKLNNLKPYYPLIIVSLIAYVFALSNNIILGESLVYDYEVPTFLVFLTKVFRSSGRFIWILFYLIVISSFIFIIKSYSKRTLRILFTFIIVVQFLDLSEAKEYFNIKFNNPSVLNGRNMKWQSPMKNPIWTMVLSDYKEINYVFTKNRPKDYFPISHFAAKNNMRINTGYFSRISKTSAKKLNRRLKNIILNKTIENDTIYFIYDQELWLFIEKNYTSPKYIATEIDNFKILAVRSN